MSETLVNILYQITISLKIPVILGLVLTLVLVLFGLGLFLREWLDRRLSDRAWSGILAEISKTETDPETLLEQIRGRRTCRPLVRRFAEQAAHEPGNRAFLDKAFADVEIEANRRCRLARIGTRLGPVLGLMGTLIPMGPALLNISQGDLEAMARDLIIAFSTTVVGLLIGGLCLIMLIFRQHWYARDLAAMEYLYQEVFFSEEDE